MMKYDITNEEKEALKLYKGFNYEAINALLTSNCDEDIALLRYLKRRKPPAGF